MLLSEPVYFPRLLRVDIVTGRPQLIGYWDGSQEAYAAVIYIRWLCSDNTWHSTLVTSKSRVTPAAGFSIPRSELSGLLMLTRLITNVAAALDVPPIRVTLAGDSTCTISCAEVNSAMLTPFFANRCVEIISAMSSWGEPATISATEEQEFPLIMDMEATCQVDKLMFTPGVDNPADAPSRGSYTLSQMGLGSLWQKGPLYLEQDRETWPLSREFIPQIPQNETRKNFLHINAVSHANSSIKIRSVMYYSNSIRKVRGIMARLCRAAKFDSQAIKEPPQYQDFFEADKWLKWLSMIDLQVYIQKHDISSLAPLWLGGLCYTQGRLGSSAILKHLGYRQLLILPPQSRYAELLMIAAHEEDHRSINDTLHRSRRAGV